MEDLTQEVKEQIQSLPKCAKDALRELALVAYFGDGSDYLPAIIYAVENLTGLLDEPFNDARLRAIADYIEPISTN